eukprot:s2122_g24.t3
MERYERLRELGRGSYGCAVLVRERRNRRQRVIKEIDLSRMPLSAQREAKNEADVLKRLKHPNIVEYCESFLEGQMLCIVMEYADGGDLSHLIKGRKAASEIICESEALKIFGQICLAIQHVHNQHILHRDLKSQNIFLTQGGCVKLGDFGIAKVLAHTAAEAITMIGTPLYLAPEVCHSQPYGMKADVWSLGVVLYELLALGPPFTGSNLAALINNIVTATPAPLAAVSQSVQDLVSDMLQKTPERRPCIQEVLTRPCIAVFESDCTPQDETFVPQHVQQKIEKHDMADSLEHLLQQTDHGHRRRPPLPESAQMANEFRKNRDAAMAVKARVEGTEGPWQWRRRSRSEEPEHAVSSRKVVDEAEHLRALQEAAAQARRDRRNGQQRLRRELETPRVRDMDSTDYEPARMRASSADEAKHLFDLHEAAAQARRDRRQIQQKLKELEKGPDPCTNQGFEVANSSRPSRTKESRESAEAQHLMALQEARAQARRDRKLIDAKRKAEAEEASENERSESTQNSTVYKPRTPEDRAAAEAKHLQALKDAAAEARRERRMLQQKIQQELGGTSQDEWSGPTPEAGASPYRRRLRQASPSPSPSKLDASSKAACGERKDSSSPEMDGLALSDSLGPLMQSLPRGSADLPERAAPSNDAGLAHSKDNRTPIGRLRPPRDADTLGSLSYSLTAPLSSSSISRADETTAKGLTFYLPLYYRIRQLALNTEKTGHRVPQKMQTELRFLEKSVAREIRSLNPLLFQRFDDVQLDRLLRALPFLRLSMGRWIFGSEQIAAAWPRATSRSFLLMSGKVHLYVDPNGVGERQELTKGAIFGENHFRLGDECMMDIVGGAAQCEEPCIIGVLGNEVLEAAYADRAFGNRKIALSMRHAPALSRVVLPESMTGPHSKIDFASLSFAEKTKILEEKQPGAVKHALEELAKVATQVHLLPGQELLSDPPVEESVVMVSKGSIEVRGDIKLSERLDALPPKRKRMRIFLDKAEKLAGSSGFLYLLRIRHMLVPYTCAPAGFPGQNFIEVKITEPAAGSVRGVHQRVSAPGLAREPDGRGTLHQKAGNVWAAFVLCLFLSWPFAAVARDGTVSPPTCVAIIDASVNCPARPAIGAKKNVEIQLKSAKDRLEAAEKEQGKTIGLGESDRGEPEMVDFWQKELERISMNETFLKDLQDRLKTDKQTRLVGQLKIETSDVAKEERFWCEALGMQRYASLPGGSVLVGFGPPSLGGEEGGYFAIKIVPSSSTPGAGKSDTSSKAPRLSFVQTVTPALVRLSRVVSTGGQLIDGYGYYAVQSPAGVMVRAYVEDRRDPVELIALSVEPEAFEEASKSLQDAGLEARGAYKLVSPEMQAYMPELPPGNMLFGSGDARQNVQVLLLPDVKESTEAGGVAGLVKELGRGPTLVVNEDSSVGVGMLDAAERPQVPQSLAKSPELTIYGPETGDSIFDKLDPYCIVKLGEFKRFQTPVMWNVGVNPQFEYQGVLTFAEEEARTGNYCALAPSFRCITTSGKHVAKVMDHDKFSADDLCGSCTVKVSDLHDGWYGKVELQRPKRTIGASKDDEQLMEPAGKIYFGVRYDYEKISALTKQAKQRVWPNQVLFNLGGNEAWGHETIMLGPVFQRTLEGAANATAFALELSNFRIIGGYQRGTNEKITLLKTSKKRFVDFVRKSQREKQFMQSCRISALDKQSTGIIKVLIERWETEDQADTMRKGLFDMSKVEEAVDPSRFRVAYRGTKAHVSVRNALNLSGGGWFDKLDPYAIVRFRGSKSEFRTSVLQDAGSDPIWNCEGPLAYNGEVALEISVWDYDHYSSDDLVGTGVEQFCNGFEGMVPLSLPSDKKKKKKTLKQSMITIGILWDAPQDVQNSERGSAAWVRSPAECQDPGVRQNEPALGMTAGTKALMS